MVKSDTAVRQVLQSYTTERKHVAFSTIRLVNAQTSLIFSTAPIALDLGIVVSEFLNSPEINKDMALKLTGFDPTNYSAFKHNPHGGPDSSRQGGDSDLLGARLTHLRPLANSEDPFTSETLRDCLTLVLLEDQRALRQVAQSWSSKVKTLSNLTLTKGEKWEGVDAFLLRPDLHIAWICRHEDRSTDWAASLEETLVWWFGDPTTDCTPPAMDL